MIGKEILRETIEKINKGRRSESCTFGRENEKSERKWKFHFLIYTRWNYQNLLFYTHIGAVKSSERRTSFGIFFTNECYQHLIQYWTAKTVIQNLKVYSQWTNIIYKFNLIIRLPKFTRGVTTKLMQFNNLSAIYFLNCPFCSTLTEIARKIRNG